MENRVDWLMRQRCDEALEMAKTNRFLAAKYMFNHMVPIDVAYRLLVRV